MEGAEGVMDGEYCGLLEGRTKSGLGKDHESPFDLRSCCPEIRAEPYICA